MFLSQISLPINYNLSHSGNIFIPRVGAFLQLDIIENSIPRMDLGVNITLQ
jgi:hypothetical protein